MKRALFQLLLVSIGCAAALAQDTIVFKNGDMLTGRVIEQNADNVIFSSTSIGSVTLKTSDIEEIRTAPPPQEKDEPTAASSEAVPPETSSEPRKADLAEQDSESKPEPQARQKGKWSGQAGLAIAMREKTYSNVNGIYKEDEFKTYRVYGNLDWKSEKNRLGWKWTYRYSEDETRKRDDFFNITQKYNHYFADSYYAEAKTVYQRDFNREIDNEYLQTAEIGKKWFQLARFKFSTSVGAGYHQYERNLPGESIRTSEPKFIFDESLEWQLISSLKLFQKYTHLGDLEKYHFVFSSGLENTLLQNLFLRMEYRIDSDTDTRYDGKGYDDKALLTSLLYKF